MFCHYDTVKCLISCVLCFLGIVAVVCLIYCHFSNNNTGSSKYVVGYAYRKTCPHCKYTAPYWKQIKNNLTNIHSIYEYDVDDASHCTDKHNKKKIDI